MTDNHRKSLTNSDRQFERAGFTWLIVLLAIVALFGGSSRTDPPQLIALRALTGLMIIPLIFYWPQRRPGGFGLPGLLSLALAGWTALQLLPLPPALWTLLPGRDIVAAMDAAANLDGMWRPISLAPGRTLNALFGLIVPGVGLLLYAIFRPERRHVLRMLVGVGAGNALLGLLQLLGPEDGVLYRFSITNPGYPVGFFANHNHSAVFSALTLLIAGYCLADTMRRRREKPVEQGALLVCFALIFLVAISGGSRAGLGATLVSLVLSAAMVLTAIRGHKRTVQASRNDGLLRFAKNPRVLLALLVIVLGALFMLIDRIPALERFTAGGDIEELRWRLLPHLLDMVRQYWLTGTGFGSFDAVYKIHEPTGLAQPTYLNQAHNDWAQLIIEGGLPAAALLIVLIISSARRIREMGRRNGGLMPILLWSGVVAVIALGSCSSGWGRWSTIPCARRCFSLSPYGLSPCCFRPEVLKL